MAVDQSEAGSAKPAMTRISHSHITLHSLSNYPFSGRRTPSPAPSASPSSTSSPFRTRLVDSRNHFADTSHGVCRIRAPVLLDLHALQRAEMQFTNTPLKESRNQAAASEPLKARDAGDHPSCLALCFMGRNAQLNLRVT